MMALGDGIVWDETVPTDATLAINIDDHMRHLYKAVRSRMALEHEFPNSQSATSEGGEHKFITFQSQGSMPTITGTQTMALYATSGPALVFASSGGSQIQLEGFISGDIILSSSTVARVGWTLISTSSDNMYIKLGNVMMTTGGSATHVHTAGSFIGPSHSHTISYQSWATSDVVNLQYNLNVHADGAEHGATQDKESSSSGTGAITGTSAVNSADPLFIEVAAWQKD